MHKKPTITIGIPAYNEEANIKNMLSSVMRQKGNFNLEKVMVVCDGCIDKTAELARDLGKIKGKIHVIEGKTRLGKMTRLNQIHATNKSEILMTFDADIVLANDYVIANIVNKFKDDRNVVLVAAHQIPVKPKSYEEKIFYTAYRIWEESRIYVNRGDHIHNHQGAASALRKDFAEKMRYPITLASDSGYLYMNARKYGKFKYAYDAPIIYRPVTTLKDFRLLSARTLLKMKNTVADHLGDEVLKEYKIPLNFKARAIAKSFIKSPLFTVLALAVNLYVRLFPLKDKKALSKKWKIVTTTKEAINI